MVKKYSLFLLGLFAMIQVATSQVTVTISDDAADAGGTVDMDITYEDFTDIISFQYSIRWNTDHFDFNSIQNITSNLPDFSISAISTPDQTGDQGVIQVSWNKSNTQPESLADGTRIFTLRLDAVGDPCDNSTVRFSNDPLEIEFANNDAVNIGANTNNGTASINGMNCSGGDGELTVTVEDVTVNKRSNQCVKIDVENFIDIQTVEFAVEFDPEIISYTGFQNANLPNFTGNGGNLNELQADQGRLQLAWFDNTAVNPVTLEGTLIEFCFDAIGTDGQVSPITIEEQIDFTNEDEVSLPYVLNNGSYTVAGGVNESDFILIAGKENIGMGQTGCIPISVRNFSDIQSMQFNVRWNPDDLIYNSVQNLNLEQLTEDVINNVGDNLVRVSWGNPTGTTVADNTVIFELCLEAKGDCDKTVPVQIVSAGGVAIEVSNTSNEELPVSVINGSATIDCDGCSIAIESLENPTCPGDADGSIMVSLPSGSYTCTWTDDDGNIIQQSSECDLVNVEAGTYTLMIDDGADCQESRTFTLEGPGTIVFGGSKVNETSGCDGSINLDMMGGTGEFDYIWDDGSTEQSRDELCAGEYCVTVTDDNGCTAETCFTITAGGPVTCGIDITNVRCNGDNDGAIDICVEGGTGPYTYAWNGPSGEFNTEDISGLLAGTYNYTITDSSDPALSSQGSVVVEQPDMITASAVPTVSSGNDGALDLSVSGGTPPYSFVWSPGGQTTEDISGLSVGTYTVMITDDNNCNRSFDFLVPSDGITFIPNLTHASCNNVCDGIIDGEVQGGVGPYTFSVGGSAITIPFNEQCPGDYELLVTDSEGTTGMQTITIRNPEVLSVEVVEKVNCSEGQADGSITVEASGGTEPYTYNWDASGNMARISNLGSGTYNVIVTDARGCTATLDSPVRIQCIDNPCFNARTIITPNGDNFNNEFVIMCATDFPNRLLVFDRWGRTVFSQEDYANDWTGTDDNGEELQDGGYLWVLEITNGDGSKEIHRGTVTILRDQF